MIAKPSTLGGNGRGRDGRFKPGHGFSRGNPLAAEVAQLRVALLRKITPKTLGKITDKLIAMSLKGNLPAISILFRYAVGKAADHVDRTDELLTGGRLDEIVDMIINQLAQCMGGDGPMRGLLLKQMRAAAGFEGDDVRDNGRN